MCEVGAHNSITDASLCGKVEAWKKKDIDGTPSVGKFCKHGLWFLCSLDFNSLAIDHKYGHMLIVA